MSKKIRDGTLDSEELGEGQVKKWESNNGTIGHCPVAYLRGI